MIWKLKHWWRRLRSRPAIVIDYSGQRTSRPQVHVTAHGFMAVQGIYSWDADESGNAKATMYGQGLANIMRCRLVDQRQQNGLKG